MLTREQAWQLVGQPRWMQGVNIHTLAYLTLRIQRGEFERLPPVSVKGGELADGRHRLLAFLLSNQGAIDLDVHNLDVHNIQE